MVVRVLYSPQKDDKIGGVGKKDMVKKIDKQEGKQYIQTQTEPLKQRIMNSKMEKRAMWL